MEKILLELIDKCINDKTLLLGKEGKYNKSECISSGNHKLFTVNNIKRYKGKVINWNGNTNIKPLGINEYKMESTPYINIYFKDEPPITISPKTEIISERKYNIDTEIKVKFLEINFPIWKPTQLEITEEISKITYTVRCGMYEFEVTKDVVHGWHNSIIENRKKYESNVDAEKIKERLFDLKKREKLNGR